MNLKSNYYHYQDFKTEIARLERAGVDSTKSQEDSSQEERARPGDAVPSPDCVSVS